MKDRFLVFLLFFNASLFPGGRLPVEAQRHQGYRMAGDRILVDSAAHWRHWQSPTHAVDITADGRVRPHFFRDRYNILDDQATFTRALSSLDRRKGETALLNLDSTEALNVREEVIRDTKGNPLYTYFLRPGISRVGSSPASAADILDGDPRTFWEPDPGDSLYNWWIEVDLGRVVSVNEIVLHFVDPDLGDPFRQFRILTAPNQKPVAQHADALEFERVGGTQAPNHDQRRFRFSLEQVDADPTWTGKLVETLRIVMTDTKRTKGKRITEAEWAALKPEDRGEIVFFARDLEGFEEPVDRAIYADLPVELQGRKEYYARERPRLADIEVWGYGDNLGLGMLEGGGSVELKGERGYAHSAAFDGDIETGVYQRSSSSSSSSSRGLNPVALTVDMGATFWLHALRMSDWAFFGYLIRTSDGTRDFSGRLQWQRLSRPEREDLSQHLCSHVQEGYDPPRKARWLEITLLSPFPDRQVRYFVTEYQLFAQGYPAEVTLTSELIELPAARHFGRLTWEAHTPPGTHLDIRTRTGDILGKVVRYFDKYGAELTLDTWKGLLGNYRGPVDTSFVPTSGWSPWSRPYRQPGDRVTSPGLRKYLQLQVEMATEDRDVAASIRSLDLELLHPVAERILAELWPAAVEVAGQVDTFEVFLQPHFIERPSSSRSPGFDEILLTLPVAGDLELLELGLTAGEGETEQLFRPASAPDLFTDAAGNPLQILSTGADSLWMRLPAALNLLLGGPRLYNRITVEGEQVPVTQDGLPLTGAAYGRLGEEEQGDIRYFRRTVDARGDVRLIEVDQSAYYQLEEAQQGPIRFFRILRGDGAPFPFDADGDTLDAAEYGRLPPSARGIVTGPGPLVRVRFVAPVFVNGTTLELAVRNAGKGIHAAAPWQSVEPGDASPWIESNTLSIQVPFTGHPIDDFHLAPNPFTPNGDGINDQTEIRFSVFKITASRQVRVRIYTLDGRPVWGTHRLVHAGFQRLSWNGVDSSGRNVPPGLYLCQVDLDLDKGQDHATRSRILSVVY